MRCYPSHSSPWSRLGFFLLLALTTDLVTADDGDTVPVTVDNFVRAETAMQFDRSLEYSGGVNQWYHLRQPAPLDQQTVIRMNRDTLYSAAIVDISDGATLTIPETGSRYVSVMVINEDHYIKRSRHSRADRGRVRYTLGHARRAHAGRRIGSGRHRKGQPTAGSTEGRGKIRQALHASPL
jgi:hypothetical protein